MRQLASIRLRGYLAGVLIVLASAVAVPALAAGPSHYHLIKTVTLGGTSFWDYMALDPLTDHLYITRGDHVTVVSGRTGAPVGEIGGLKEIHGVAFAGSRGYISDGGANDVVVFDRRTLRKLGKIPAGPGPDNILYDPYSHRVFAFDGHDTEATAIDVRTGQAVGTVALGGRPEAAASDDHGSIFVNIEDKSEIAEFNSKTLAVERRWPLAPCAHPSGIAIDAAHHRLFSGCRNAVLAVSNTQAGRVITTVPIGQGVDSNRFDPRDGLIFSSNGRSGNLTVIKEVTPNEYHVVRNVPTALGARTMELDPRTGRVYLVTAKLIFPKQTPAPTAKRRFPRPTIVPHSFELLIFAR
ncbi:MAG: YncE family protein [Steroidobacteraceae bacterium]